MSQKNKGIYNLLSNTFFYSLVQKIMSATSFREKIIKQYITQNNVKVLDVGCGPAEILNILPNIKYYGFDINPTYINSAKKKYQNKGRFFCKKFTNKDTKRLPKFDHVLLLGILHHLNDKEINTLMLNIKKVLKKNGNIITLDNIFTSNQNIIAKFLIQMDKGENVRSKKGYLSILKKHFKKIHSKIHHQRFIPYTWFVTNCIN
jgi:ubiquinone/menaquinone biosynthesis C-methylase UbiE